MTILPLVGRELLVRARSAAGYWTRFGAALAGMFFCLPALMLAQGSITSRAQMGNFAFHGLVVAAFILCCFAGFMTVDGISRERREGTLGLLFLTHVKALDVLLGNFGAAGIASLCALMAFVPVLIIPVLAGGVSGGEAARKVLVLLDTMILSLAAGLWASARGRGWMSCARSAAGILALVIFGPLLLERVFPPLPRLGFTWPGPLNALTAAEDSVWQKAVAPYWISLAVVHVISWLLVLGAGRRLRRTWREEDETPAHAAQLAPVRARPVEDRAPAGAADKIKESVSAFRAWPAEEAAPVGIQLARHNRLAAGEAPLGWLVRRQCGVRGFVWIGAILGSLYQGDLLLGRTMRRLWGPYSSWGSSLAFALVEGCLFAWASSRFFIEARRGGELELLLTTPEGASTLIASQWKWLKEVFRLPVLLLVLPPVLQVLLMMPSLFSSLGFFSFGYGSFTASYLILSQFLYVLNILVGTGALVWVAMWYGWSERSQARAIVRTIILAKGASYLIALLVSIALERLVPPVIFYTGQVNRWREFGALAGLEINPVIFYTGQVNPWLILIRYLPYMVQLFFYFWLFRWAKRKLATELPQEKIRSG